MAGPKERRRYSGQSFEDRLADRRARLIEAALEVAAQAGLEGTSVAAICGQAGLTARYFYESFPSREAIFVEAYRLAQQRLLGHMGSARNKADPAKGALKSFFTALYEHRDVARVFLIDLDDHGGAMRMASFEGSQKLSKALGLKATHPLMVAGIIGAVVDIGKRWIESDFMEPLENVVEIARSFTQIRA